MTSFNTLQSISSRLSELSTQLSASKLSKEDLEEFEMLSRKLYERAVILNYKAKEENVYGKSSDKVPNQILPFENEERVEETVEESIEEVIDVVESGLEPEVIVPQEDGVVENDFTHEKEEVEPFFEGLFGGLDERVQFDFSGGFETPKVEESSAVEPESSIPVVEETEVVDTVEVKPEEPITLEEPIIEEDLKEEPEEEIIEETIEHIDEPIVEEKSTPSLNEVLQGADNYLSEKSDSFYNRFTKSYNAAIDDKLGTSKITTLKGAVGLNDRLLFISELFGGDSSAYNESIEILDELESSELALRKLSEIAAKHNWNKEDASVDEFAHLITRRYVD